TSRRSSPLLHCGFPAVRRSNPGRATGRPGEVVRTTMRPRALTAALAAIAAVAPVVAGAASPASAAQRPPPFAESGVLTVGARGPAVRALQREMRSRGIPVAVDGRFGPGTRLAVARLQKRLGLRINGIVDRSLLWWLGI